MPPSVSFAQALRGIFPANGFAMRGKKAGAKLHAVASAARALGSTFPAGGGGANSANGVKAGNGGAKRDRTADLLHAMQALSQLSYGPNSVAPASGRGGAQINS